MYNFCLKGHKRLKKTFEAFRKATDSDLTVIFAKIEQSVELLTDKLSRLESDHQDHASHHEHLKRSLSNLSYKM